MSELGEYGTGLLLIVEEDRREASLWRRLGGDNDSEARQALFDKHSIAARALAKRAYFSRQRGNMTLGDFEHAAYEALLRAIDRFDPKRVGAFPGYLRSTVDGAIADMLGRWSEAGTQYSTLRKVHGERLRSLRNQGSEASQVQSDFSQLVELTVGIALGLLLEDTGMVDTGGSSSDVAGGYSRSGLLAIRMRISEEVDNLDEPQKTIVLRHYVDGLTFAQISDMLKLSRGRVSQLHRAGLSLLRGRLVDDL